MTIQIAEALRNAILDLFETTIGESPVLEIRTGAQPADCAAADSGTLLASLTLPADWMNAAASGSKTLKGTWQDASADDTGTAGHFRLKSSLGTVYMQGSITATGGGGDMTLVSTSIVATMPLNITTFTLNAGHA